jgi:putative DNA primase/helicase
VSALPPITEEPLAPARGAPGCFPLDNALSPTVYSQPNTSEVTLNTAPPTEAEYEALLKADARSRLLRLVPDSDLTNAEALAARYGEDIRYVPGKGFFVYRDGRFCRDPEGLQVTHLAGQHAKAVVEMAQEGVSHDDARVKVAKRLLNEKIIRSTVSLLKTLPDIHCAATDLNKDPYLFNVRNGTIDLRTGALHPHSRNDFITQISPVVFDPTAECPRWKEFITKICCDRFDGDRRPALEALLQRIAGYLLTGSCSEQVIFFFLGDGANGKTTWVETISALLGEYATTTGSETFMHTRSDQHPTAVADLAESRFVYCGELAESAKINEERMKAMTGEERRKARFMHQNFFEFIPKFKIIFGTNHLPEVPTTDRATWRRIIPVPFSVTIPPHARDLRIQQKLRFELPGILNWAIDGCRMWQGQRLDPNAVPCVEMLRVEYHEEEDHVTAALNALCEFSSTYWIYATDLYRVYRKHVLSTGGSPLTPNMLGRRLKLRFKSGHTRDGRLWHGLRLRDDVVVPALGSQGDFDDPVDGFEGDEA